MTENLSILTASGAGFQIQLAAKELRRYYYLRTGYMPEILAQNQMIESVSQIIVAARDDSLALELADMITEPPEGDQDYRLQTFQLKNGTTVLAVLGGSELGALYGAYKLLEILGVRFYLHGDTIPDEKISPQLPQIDESGKPIFELRGIVPFHDFPEGPDWWNEDEYLAVISQLPKLRMNFVGLHTYPEKFDKFAGAEPAVWIGPPELVGEGSKVNKSYASRHFTTLNDRWGYQPRRTSEFRFGTDRLFEHDIYAAEYMLDLAPNPSTPEQCNLLFQRFGDLLNNAFTAANTLGIKTCLGTEIPLTVPVDIKKYLQEQGIDPEDEATVTKLYEGMFKRIMQSHPLDFYWLWTHEYWIRGNTEQHEQEVISDLQAAVRAAEQTKSTFNLATSGWVLGPQGDRSKFDRLLPKNVAMSTLNGAVGYTPLEPAFAKITNRPKWALPWIEDDGAMTLPQLWAGRIRRDAADAKVFGCNGIMANHWRTRVLSPNVGALGAACWEQESWSPYTGKDGVLDDLSRTEGPMEGTSITIENTVPTTMPEGIPEEIFQTARVGLKGYSFKIPSGRYNLSLLFGDVKEFASGRSSISIRVQGEEKCQRLDLSQQQGTYILHLDEIKIFQNVLKIDIASIEGKPFISGIIIDGATFDFNQIKGKPFTRKINCGGPAIADFEAELPDYRPGPRSFDSYDFYLDWAQHEFGSTAAKAIAEIFAKVDGHLPRPVEWGPGPGGRIISNRNDWETVSGDYAFVDEFAALRSSINGKGNIDRYHFWLNQFQYLKTIGQAGCLLGQYDVEEEKMKSVSPEESNASESMKKLQEQIIHKLDEMSQYLLAAVRSMGELGNIANIQTQAIELLLQRFREVNPELKLPQSKSLDLSHPGMVVPTVRSSLQKGEALKLKVLMLDPHIDEGVFYWKTLGTSEYASLPLRHVARSVYSVILPGENIQEDFEYYIEAKDPHNNKYHFPPTAPEMNQTVIILPEH